MRNIAMRFTAIGLFTLVWALPAWAQRMPNDHQDQHPVTRSDDDADFDSADAPDDGDAPMASRRPRQGRGPVQHPPTYHDQSYQYRGCPSWCLGYGGRPLSTHAQDPHSMCPANCMRD
jgi:hypothetical protein